MDRATAWGLKGPGFDSSQGHVLGISPVGGVQEAADQWLSLIDVSKSLSLSLPLCTKSIKIYIFLKSALLCQNRFGSVDWVSACRLKGPRFDSGQGHVHWLRGTSPVVGVQEAAGRCFSLINVSNSLSLSLPLCKKINEKKSINIFKKKQTINVWQAAPKMKESLTLPDI